MRSKYNARRTAYLRRGRPTLCGPDSGFLRRRAMTEKYDLVVVGAGPGGPATAYYTAKAGVRTLLLDRQEFPRDKPCGDGLMPHAASEVSLMGLGDWLDEPHHGKFTGFSIYTETAFLRQGVPPSLHGPCGYVAKREETDARSEERRVGKECRSRWSPYH